jgi:hypothetical protein
VKLSEWVAAPSFISILPWLLLGTLTAGVTGGSWAAWKIQGGRLATEQAAHSKLKERQALVEYLNAAARAQAKLDLSALSTDLAHSRKQREIVTVEVVRVEYEKVASPTRACLSPDTRRVLFRPGDRAPAGDRGAAKPAGAAVPVPAGGAPTGFVSELAMSRYIEQIEAAFVANRDAFRGPVGVIHALERAGVVKLVD